MVWTKYIYVWYLDDGSQDTNKFIVQELNTEDKGIVLCT
jgi:hypothetical protein